MNNKTKENKKPLILSKVNKIVKIYIVFKDIYLKRLILIKIKTCTRKY